MEARRTLNLRIPALVALFLPASIIGGTFCTAPIDSGSDRESAPQALQQGSVTCDDFVYLKDGRFMLADQRYQLVGTNLAMSVGARVTNAEPGLAFEDFTWEYFLAPYGNYYPDNNAVCAYFPWGWSPECCDSAASCRAMLQDDHVARLVALGVENVRLLGLGFEFDEDGHPSLRCERVADVNSERDWRDKRDCRVDLSIPANRARAFGLIREAVDLLGASGIRTILLAGGKNIERAAAHPTYLQLLRELGLALSNDPWLIGVDFMNEPPYFYDESNDSPQFDLCGDPSAICKAATQAITRAWFQAAQSTDRNHLFTTGLGTTAHIPTWDPMVLYDHFTSWHVYPPSPWDEGEPIHGSRPMAGEVYHASLAACGLPCPYLGSHDGANCFVAAGPVPARGGIGSGSFYYDYISPGTGDRCRPPAIDDGARCRVATWEPGRDEPFILDQPVYYVIAKAGSCPAGTSFDGANCVVTTAPPGARASIWQSGYYYDYLAPTGERCRPPAVDDGAHCYVGPVPAGYQPFILTRPLYYVTSVACGPRKPAIFGETGFAVYPNGRNLDRDEYLPIGTPLWSRYAECTYPAGVVRLRRVADDRCIFISSNGVVRNKPCGDDGAGVFARDDAGSGQIRLRDLRTGRCLVGDPRDGGAATSAPCEAVPEQAFVLDDAGSGNVRLHHVQSGKCLYGTPRDGGTVHGWVCWSDPNMSYTLDNLEQTTVAEDRPHGSDGEREAFLFGDAAAGWVGLYPMSHACGFQGLDWWTFADQNWGMCSQDNFGLFTRWDVLGSSPPGGDVEALVERPIASRFRDDIDYTVAPALHCDEPPSLHALNERSVDSIEHVYTGHVVDTAGSPVNNALVYGWNVNWAWDGRYFTTYSDVDGSFAMRMKECMVKIGATDYGRGTDEAWTTCAGGGGGAVLDVGTLVLAPVPHLPDLRRELRPPDRPRRACREGGEWVVRSGFPSSWRGPLRLRHETTGACLYVAAGDGGAVKARTCRSEPSMEFQLEDLGAGEVRLRHRLSGQCVYGEDSDGAAIHHWSCWNDPNMVFLVESLGGDRVRLRHEDSGKCVHVGSLWRAVADGDAIPSQQYLAYNSTCWDDAEMVFVIESL